MTSDASSTPANAPGDADADARARRLTFRAWRRGFKEADMILGTFADEHLSKLDAAGLDEFERILDAPDQDLYAWVSGRAPVPEAYAGPVMDLLRSFGYFARTLWSGTSRGS